MRQLLIIPNSAKLEESLFLAEKYNTGFEFNDFFVPKVLDSDEVVDEIIGKYKIYNLPNYCTVHGAFFDVIPFSADEKIKEVSNLRIKQSIKAAQKIGATAVVFHTNYNPFLSSKEYVNSWIKTNIEYWSNVLKENPSINIYLENMFDTTPDLMMTLSEEFCKYNNFGVCLDYAHASLSKVSPKIWAEKLGKYVKHIHINDNDGVSDLHLAWGDGVIDRKGFYEVYEKYMNDATILIETTDIKYTSKSLAKLKEEWY